MPIYEYQCTKCGHHLEIIQKMSDEPLTKCPECHQPTLTKQISAAGFQLKGGGWYLTDYSSKGKEKKSETSQSEKKDKSSTDKSSTDSGATSS